MQTIFEQIQFIGYTSTNPILILGIISSLLFITSLIYLWARQIYTSIPKELVFLVSGLMQYISIILITQHTLPYHQQIIWAQVGWFFALWSQVDDVRIQGKKRIHKWIFSGVCMFITIILFWNTPNIVQSMTPLITWTAPISLYFKPSKQKYTDKWILIYLVTTWSSGIILSIWTWFTV